MSYFQKIKEYLNYKNNNIIIIMIINDYCDLDLYFKFATKKRYFFKKMYFICIYTGVNPDSVTNKYIRDFFWIFSENKFDILKLKILKCIKDNYLTRSKIVFINLPVILYENFFLDIQEIVTCNVLNIVNINVIFDAKHHIVLNKYIYSNYQDLDTDNYITLCNKENKIDSNISEDIYFIRIKLFNNYENFERVFNNIDLFLNSIYLKYCTSCNNNYLKYLKQLISYDAELVRLKYLKIKIPKYLQEIILYVIYRQVRYIINFSEEFVSMTQKEIDIYIGFLKKIILMIDYDVIFNFNEKVIPFFYKIGIASLSKSYRTKVLNIFLENLDDKNNELLFKFYTFNVDSTDKIFINNQELYIVSFKIRQHMILNRIFIYEKRFWVKSLVGVKKFNIFVNKEYVKCILEDKMIDNFKVIDNKLKNKQKRRSQNKQIWLFADMPLRADDNAEHLYRYIMRNHPERRIYYILRKESKDWDRLIKEKFKLVDPKSFKFKYLVFKADKLISSHLDRYFFEAIGKNTLETKDFVFLQHGVTQNDISGWLNKRTISLLIVATEEEYQSIAGNFNSYKFTSKEVKLTGFPRWDSLLKNNKTNTKQILVMPTWRSYIVGTYSKKRMSRRIDYNKFYESEFFYMWNSFLHSKELKNMCEKYNYKVLFQPHPQVIPYLEGFFLPKYIKIHNRNLSIQRALQESSIIITDYSSIAFDMKLLNKEILYYHFDKEYFFKNHFVQPGYFNYNEEIYGRISYNQVELLNRLEIIISNHNINTVAIDKRTGVEYEDDLYSKRVFDLIKG
ncbi:CDP-glycerol glycerophosphotransferase family protein [Campylobacter insulaenigrae]|uniref:CDP-glycerol glycerophosphotransferase family protein n=2 Tax=Campylobacter insulaenigrae TaxID=260714 RepID=UPI0021521EC1|nr:CDP-glycerol glycerophosphotransferase family protein [Campylobacter insulaenigrae]MCR6575372.1 CDP-glycerol glycerophosphotransferase family protein [Campylobacter insulaenigrae]